MKILSKINRINMYDIVSSILAIVFSMGLVYLIHIWTCDVYTVGDFIWSFIGSLIGIYIAKKIDL